MNAHYYGLHQDCGACLGSGQQQDVIGVKDALVDAETLRRALRGADDTGSGLRRGTRLYKALTAANEAEFCGLVSAKCGPDHLITRYARSAARAAFRAVPGLRGER